MEHGTSRDKDCDNRRDDGSGTECDRGGFTDRDMGHNKKHDM